MATHHVALIYGGVSGEHSVSCLTAASVLGAIDPERYSVIPIGITTEGIWVPMSTEEVAAGADVEYHGERVLADFGPGGGFVVRGEDGSSRSLGPIDVAFPLLHGPFGEDGTIQGTFEMMGIPYVGCGVFASAAAMDKHYMKLVLESAGLPVAPYVLVEPQRWNADPEGVRAEVAERLQLPVYVKPARAGSSLGITRVAELSQLDAAIATARAVDPKVIVETGIPGREIECAVLGGRGGTAPRASVLGEIVLDVQWYDYATKYVATEGFHMEIPAALPDADAEKMRGLARRVFEVFECEGMTRVDFFYTATGEMYVNEHNTIPGFTAVSMYPILWEKTGLAYRDLISELIELALARGVGLR
ncbi:MULTISPECIES: D-alanine--D-alanine ligase family protein [Actinotignum]|uniref:D-alanine--D-alanine ligase n=1 Tax=Actinotignum timonense TaxID=1870995 RepID=A0AAW9HBL2_9ACTO|nr:MULTISPECIES: D-alanine--D-alanine ligase family protein [Actinotignum]MDE1557794.1 D-alanine--D-alanine ligase [Actinotignum schaalii]MDE1663706.1 D-alanine--D-alanine ligase [Actinotignum schaalii]MDK6373916.1 D-alanine--D-alanine ligase family protein [Actinotignum timonense]MDK6644392.1 D-alanine--D-alanine ligase family protein [Actinotignum timonense]MDK6780079.1 D-alanine--D-alanine ligase family protein [Actinotignum timonense]